MNLAWWLERSATEHADRDALIDVATGERVTFAELGARADRIAAGLREDAGVRVDEVVATIMPDDPWHVAVLFGVMKIGAVFSGYNRMLNTAKFAEDAARSRVRTLIVGAAYADAGRAVAEQVACVERVLVITDLIRMAEARQGSVRVEPGAGARTSPFA